MSVPLPADESARLAALARAAVLDTAPEEAYDRLTRLAAGALGVPWAAVHLVAEGRLFVKSCWGPPLAGASLTREGAPCAWTILAPGPLVIEDLAADPRFGRLLLGDAGPVPEPRMYAGVPLVTAGGEALGTLCVFDSRVRALDAREQEVLRGLAALVVDELERRVTRAGPTRAGLVRAAEETRLLQALAGLTDQLLTPQETARRALGLLHAALPLGGSALVRLTPAGLDSSDGASGGARRDEPLLAALARACTPEGARRLRAALGGGEPLLLSGEEVARTLPGLEGAGRGGLAWLPLPGAADHALVLVRGGPGDPLAAWPAGERPLLAAAARSVGVALERAEAARRLEGAARTDPLTGLGNRRALDAALEDADRDGGGGGLGPGYVLAVVDLDGMRRVNDEYGHARGDELLREFARHLGLPDVTAYRLGGDEFALLHLRPDLPEVAAQALVNRVAGAVRYARSLTYPVGASVGVATVPDDAPGATGALRAAQRRMYAQKRARRGTEHGR